MAERLSGARNIPRGAGAGDRLKVVIVWDGLPYYAARVIQFAQAQLEELEIKVVSCRDGIPYAGIEGMIRGGVAWVDRTQALQWADLGMEIPDVVLITSWPHRAYMDLAQQAKPRGAKVVCMVDNYLRYTPKQWVGALYFRAVLRRLFDAMWVPGSRSRRFMRFLGMPDSRIYEGLYAADDHLFRCPSPTPEEVGPGFQPQRTGRRGILFVGQFIDRKGIPTVLEVTRAQPRWVEEMLFVGAGEREPEMRAAGLRCVPFCQPPELVKRYQSHSALLLPSVLDHWAVVVHEAALCGCLLLVTRQCGSVDELVRHKVNGYVMERSSPEEIQAAFDWFSGLHPQAIDEGRRVSLQLANQLTLQTWSDTLRRIVREVLAR